MAAPASLPPLTNGTGQAQRHLQVPVQLTDIFISLFRKSLQDNKNQGLSQAAGVLTILTPRQTPLKTQFCGQNTIPKICSFTASCQNNPFSFPHFPGPFPSLHLGCPHFPMVIQRPSLTPSLPPILLTSFTLSNIACKSSPPAQRQHSWGSFKLLSGQMTK